MRKLGHILAPIIFGAIFTLLNGNVYAVNLSPICNGTASGTAVCQSINQQTSAGTNPINAGLKDALLVVSYVAGVASVVLLMISAIRFVSSRGDAGGVKSARDTIVYVVVGLFVIILAQTIIVFVLDKVNL